MLHWLRNHKVLAASLLIIIIGLFALAYNLSQREVRVARAGTGDSHLYGWAWTDTIGWISLSGTADDGTVYGVTGDDAGNLDGYAWSEHVGWINFDPANQDFPASETYRSAYFDASDNTIKGWARVEALDRDITDDNAGQYGWIKMSGTADDGSNYGVKALQYNPVTDFDKYDDDEDNDGDDGDFDNYNEREYWGDLIGYAWNGFSRKRGLGWFSFNCADEGVCATSAYEVSGQPDPLNITDLDQTDGEDSNSITIKWTDANNETYHQVLRRHWVCDGGQRMGEHCYASFTGKGVASSCPACDIRTPDCDGRFGEQKDINGNDKVFTPRCEDKGYSYLEDINGSVVTLDDVRTQFSDGSEDESPRTPELGFYASYEYIILGCNIFGCAMADREMHYTSPIDAIPGVDMVPVCKAEDASGNDTSFAYIFWQKPYFPGFSPVDNIVKYEVEYCILNTKGQPDDCTAWQSSACDDITEEEAKHGLCLGGNNDGDQCLVDSECDSNECGLGTCFSGATPGMICHDDDDCGVAGSCRVNNALRRCRDEIINNKTKYWIYRIRAIGDAGVCVNDFSRSCDIDANDECAIVGGDCDYFKSSWGYSAARRICSPGGSYVEIRPE